MKIWEVKDTTTDKNTRSLHGAFNCECNKHVELTDAIAGTNQNLVRVGS